MTEARMYLKLVDFYGGTKVVGRSVPQPPLTSSMTEQVTCPWGPWLLYL